MHIRHIQCKQWKKFRAISLGATIGPALGAFNGCMYGRLECFELSLELRFDQALGFVDGAKVGPSTSIWLIGQLLIDGVKCDWTKLQSWKQPSDGDNLETMRAVASPSKVTNEKSITLVEKN